MRFRPAAGLGLLWLFAAGTVFASTAEQPTSLARAEAIEELRAKNKSQNPNPARRTESLDRNNDGFREVKIQYEDDMPVLQENDENKDGKPDGWIVYEGGKKSSGTRDTDYDGKVDSWIRYKKNGVWRRSKDTSGDGKPDLFIENQGSILLIVREKDRNFDGKIDWRSLQEFGDQRLPNPRPNGQMDYISVPGYSTILKVQDDDYDGKIDLCRDKSSKEAAAKRIGQPIQTEPWSGQGGF